MILCHCAVVDHWAVEAAVDDGACTLREVLVRTGAGRDCGGCVPALRQRTEALLGQSGHSHPLAPSTEVVHAAG